MARIRFGVVGVGGMGTTHAGYLAKMKTAKLTAVCDIVRSRATSVGEEFGVKSFLDYRELVQSGLVDAVIVATPHLQHPEISMCAMKNGVHVICEKPLGVTLTPVDKLIGTAKKTGCKFAVMYQWRTQGIYQKAKNIIQSGQIGELLRVHFIKPDYRCQAYYDQDAWRGTWAEEGGGVLVNQAPHFTDILWYLTGSPKTITGKVRTKLHRIEAEDEAEAMLEYPNRATGYYYTCTTECPGRTYMRIAGNKGVLDIEGDRLRLGELKPDLTRFDRVNKEPWAGPKVAWRVVPYKKSGEVGHRAIIRNFINAINRGTKLISPGDEGIHQVEISCAIVLSSMKNKPVRLPVKRAEYDELMASLVRTSRVKKTRKPAARKQEVKVFT